MARSASRDVTHSGGGDDLVAVIVSTRPYAAIDLVPMLIRHRITSIERGRVDALTFVQHLQPNFVIAVVDPSRIEDLDLVRNLSRASAAMIMVLSPSNDALAAALRAGADVYARDEDGHESLDAQIAALRRRALSMHQPDVEEILEVGPIRISRAARRCWGSN